MPNTDLSLPFGQRVRLPGHFDVPVILEDARALGENGSGGYECRVRLPDGSLDEAVISVAEAKALFAITTAPQTTIQPVDAERLRLLIESARIRLAYTHDKQFAVSLSGIRTLPHQVEAGYQRMLPQPRLRFLLADDPGAGKTIMAGLLIKELKLREAIERVLILCPAPLTIQWQDEMLRWFGEPFDIIFAAVDQQQLVNPWQRSSQVVASLDYAKQDDVRERVWQQQWDLVIIDEAHKCSAYTKSQTGRSDEPVETKRYQLAKRLTVQADHVVLLTATPHHGDEDRFAHFLRLLDPDLFPEPHKIGRQAAAIRKNVFQLGTDCPWALRRLKEDLRDLNGRRLFPDRHAHTVSFCLNSDEYLLYKAVTNYINEFLPQQSGQRRSSAALARTVLQRRLASSLRAIHESLKRRLQKQQDLLEELEGMTPSQRARRLAALQGRLPDAEQEEDDLDDAARDALVDEYTAALELDQLQREVAVLKDLVKQARRVRELGNDSKLTALKQSLSVAQFAELKDGRGKLLIFTEHRDTLNAVRENIVKWGYSTCEIHGGLNPHERKRAQEEFRTTAQICIATEAAGEGINLQFCHLMINYDMPWNPTRLEQRLGRIHRIGQERDVHVFNFVATDSEDGEPIIEGRILHRLLEKLDQMRDALTGRVFDVIGEVLSLNDVNLPEMLREVAYDPRRLEEYIDQIDRIDPARLKQYEEATGIALARANVDFSGFQARNLEIEERRLMPRYVEAQFVDAAREVGLRVEPRADGLWRIEYVLAELRSDRLHSVQRLGKPESSYRKITFHKHHLEAIRELQLAKVENYWIVGVQPGREEYADMAKQEQARKRYLSDLTDEQWVILKPMLPSPRTQHGGAPRQVDMRAVLDTLLYQNRTGCQWDMLPHDLLPKSTVYDYFAQWRDDGTWAKIVGLLRTRVRIQAGREPTPSAACIDSQSVKTTEVGGLERGYDGGKKVSGRKRHVLVDTIGLLLVVLITSAALDDGAAAIKLLTQISAEDFPRLTVIFGDSKYHNHDLHAWLKEHRPGWRIEVKKRPVGSTGFIPLPKRWVVERTNAWNGRARRNSKDYERKPESSAARIHLSNLQLMLRRLSPGLRPDFHYRKEAA